MTSPEPSSRAPRAGTQPDRRVGPTALDRLLADLRACRACADAFAATPTAHEPRPVVQASDAAAPIALVGQAPGARVHASGLPFDDPSGDRLRAWLGVDRSAFHDPARFAILPMGFCFPGHDSKGGDRPPPRLCADLWRERLFAVLPRFRLLVLIGRAAIAWHAPALRRLPLAEAVGPLAPEDAGSDATARIAEAILVLPHPSWRNTAWLRRNPRFEAEIAPELQRRVAALLERS
jgi:uracil-DNA glycosylase